MSFRKGTLISRKMEEVTHKIFFHSEFMSHYISLQSYVKHPLELYISYK